MCGTDRGWHLDRKTLDKAGRPSLLTITDRASRKVVATRVELDPTPAALADFVAKACQDFGVPERLATDHGMAYMSKAFCEAANSLGINLVVEPVQPLAPTSV
jgi:hypothetical protein